jgi:HEPN domain-containing protein
MPASHLRACAYHAQQAVEKAMKCYLAHHKVRFPKTHIIKDLLKLIDSVDPALAKKMAKASRLTKYAIEYRYPDAATKRMTREKARSAARLSEQVYQLIATDLRGR